jgi:CDP-diacylglycerol---serine O-phosphatidyltransferase
VRKIAILPTLLTLGNAVCGFSAIVVASRIDGDPDRDVYYFYSAWLIVAGMLFDVLDGFVARLSKTASDFGGQLDSLCDAVSFGAAPAFLILRLSAEWREGSALLYNATVVIAVLFMVCVILRLARFNVENDPDPASHRRFKGLPSPAGAGCIVSLAILRSHTADSWLGLKPDFVREVVKYWAPLGGLGVALLMVSRVSYPHLTKQVLRGRRHYTYLLRIILVVFVLALARELSLLVVFWGYALTFAVRHAIAVARRRQSGADGGEKPPAPDAQPPSSPSPTTPPPPTT